MLVLSYEVHENLLTARAHAQIMRRINRGVLERWRDRFLPRHFVGGASQRYGYQPQSPRYVAWKRRKVGHNIPYVLTGKLRDKLRTDVQITATQHGGRAKGRGYFPMPARMRSDLERITPEETEQLAEWALNEYVRLASKPEYKRKRRRRGSNP